MSKSKIDKGVIVDLDETLLTINTFKCFIKFCLTLSLNRNNYWVFFKTLWIISLRKLKILKHSIMKYRLLNLCSNDVTANDIKIFIDTIIPFYINQDVFSLIKKFKRKNYRICLSTAAPEIYVNEIANRISFDYVLCTKYSSSLFYWQENIREQKAINTLMLFKAEKISPHIIITDHYDDLPLMKEVDFCYIVSPSNKTKHILKQNKISYLLLKN
jgi:phosphoserine phosphatase